MVGMITKSHTYAHPDGRVVEHPGLRVNCSICMCDPRYNPAARKHSPAVQALIEERRGWMIRMRIW